MNGVTERRNRTLKDMVRSMISHSSLLESLWEEALKTTIYILNRLTKPLMNFGLAKKPIKARPYRLHERKLDSRIISCYFVGYVKRSRGYKFYDPTSRSFFETGNARTIEEVEFEKDEKIRNVVFEEEFVNDIGQVLILFKKQL
ncbi:hypothetical protein CR513_54347, partial [Mucuna pruriens]